VALRERPWEVRFSTRRAVPVRRYSPPDQRPLTSKRRYWGRGGDADEGFVVEEVAIPQVVGVDGVGADAALPT